MSIFYLWNPTISAKHREVLEFVITQGDAYGIANGTRDFFVQAANALGVVADIVSWTVRPYRSKYYTDYLGEADWRDNWRLLWKARVVASQPLGRLSRMSAPWIDLNATDETWQAVPDDKNALGGCLVVSDFANAPAVNRAKKFIKTDGQAKTMQRRYGLPDPIFSSSSLPKKYRQLHVDLGRLPISFFSGGADYAEHVMGLCKKANGTVHFAERSFL